MAPLKKNLFSKDQWGAPLPPSAPAETIMSAHYEQNVVYSNVLRGLPVSFDLWVNNLNSTEAVHQKERQTGNKVGDDN